VLKLLFYILFLSTLREETMLESEALEAILQELQKFRADLVSSKKSLGFGAAPKTTQYVFCNRTKGGIWYTLDSQSQPVPVEHPALTGYIRKLEFKETLRRSEKTHKLHCIVEADSLYVLESSSKAHFSKGLLSAIATLSPAALELPVTIVPQPSVENGEVLFCNLYQGSKQIFAPYDEQTDWRQVSRTAIDGVKAANGDTVQFSVQSGSVQAGLEEAV
jgi:hypothetical protein